MIYRSLFAGPSARILLATTLVVLLAVQLRADSVTSDSINKISFVNDIVPILTKAGCNSGKCHAKAGGGQNGFELSLLGFEPQEDYRHLVLEGRGRRLFPMQPEQSLLLQKASAQVPHGGGEKIPKDSDHYQTLLKWIEEGSPFDTNTTKLVSISVLPTSSLLKAQSSIQLRAIASFEDGSQCDVTNLSLFETGDRAMATVNHSGLVTAADIPGKVAIMVRFQDRVAAYHAAIPLGEPLQDVPEPNNFVDQYVFENLRQLGIRPSTVCDDPTFLRRVCLDIAGRLPTETETQAFLADKSPDKRSQFIDVLLRSPGYADYFANKWSAVLKNRRDDQSDITANFAFHSWLRDNLLAGTAYDQMVRELLAATGTIVSNPPVAWYKRVKDPKNQIEDIGQLFLGVRLQCAQCHHHPFERWSQHDYYSLAAFFSRVGRKPTEIAGEDLIFHKRGIAETINVKTGKSVKPAALGDDVGTITADDDPRLRLADWMASPGNPFFAKALVNRYWKHFLGRGLVEPEDDIRDTNPPTNPELLQALEQHFVGNDFDLRELVRVITNSKTYQLSSVPNDQNLADRQNHSRFYPKRLQAEVLLDAIDQFAGTSTSFANLPNGTRAVALPDNSYNTSSPFLKVFGRPEATSVCECERVQSGSLSQSLHLMNAKDVKGKVATTKGRIQRLLQSQSASQEIINDFYLAAFSRLPTEEETEIATNYLNSGQDARDGKPGDTAVALRNNAQDLMWAIMNTKEFLFNH